MEKNLIRYSDCTEYPPLPGNEFTGSVEITVDGVRREDEIYRIEWFDDGTKRLLIYVYDADGRPQLNADGTDIVRAVVELCAESIIVTKEKACSTEKI